MIDYFALALAHALLVIALLRILARGELDREEALDNVIAWDAGWPLPQRVE